MAGSPNGVRITGLNETIRALSKLENGVEELKDAMSSISKKAANDAKALAPVGATGKLQASIKPNRAKGKAIVRAGTNKGVPYAVFNEFGTSKISAKEFVTKAVQQNRAYALTQIEQELNKIIRKYGLN